LAIERSLAASVLGIEEATTSTNGDSTGDTGGTGGTGDTGSAGGSDDGETTSTSTSPVGGNEIHISTETQHVQNYQTIAALKDGRYVVTWQSWGQDGSVGGIYGQILDAQGNAVGSEFQVNSEGAGQQNIPTVTALDDGGFQIVWSDYGQAPPANAANAAHVYGQRYDNTGSAVGTNFQINTYSDDNLNYYQSIATLNDGKVAVVWNSDDQDGDEGGIYGQLYDADGTALGTEFQVSTTTAKDQTKPDLAPLSDGGFLVSWQTENDSGTATNIYGKKFDSTGAEVASPEAVTQGTTSSATQVLQESNLLSTIAPNGTNVSAGRGVWLDLAPGGQSPNYTVIDLAAGQDVLSGPHRAVQQADGSWEFYNDSTLVLKSDIGEVVINEPNVAVKHPGKDLFSWIPKGTTNLQLEFKTYGNREMGDDDINIFTRDGKHIAGSDISNATWSQLGFNTEADLNNNLLTEANGFNSTATYDGSALNSGGTEYSVPPTNETTVAGMKIKYSMDDDLGDPANPANNASLNNTILERGAGNININNGYETVTIDTVTEDLLVFVNGATYEGGEVLIHMSGDNIYQQGQEYAYERFDLTATWDSMPTAADAVNAVAGGSGTTAGSEFQINTTTTNDQTSPSVAGLADGGFVTAWGADDQDGDGSGIYSQRYDSAGNKIGAEQKVNTTTSGNQTDPAVTALSDDGYVVVWTSDGDQDGSGSGVYGQQFDSDGNTVGTEFLVNSYTTDDQKLPDVVGSADGKFFATWTSQEQDGDDGGVYGRIFDIGTTSTGETSGSGDTGSGDAGSGDDTGGTGNTTEEPAPATRSVQDITFSTFEDSQEAIRIADRAIEQLSTMASSIGAVMNRFETVVRNLGSMHVNQSATRSRIMDADIAKETADLTRVSVMQQAGTAVLAQANQQPQLVLQLLG
ncbi:MAG: hypothetical protein HQL69_22375, partial [Magnetococcales bacterium]|nr:hypothetical protein [Magnetococcales bacterium]